MVKTAINKLLSSLKRGFTLFYAIIIVSIIGIIVGTAVTSIMAETGISRDEGESLKAYYAADTAIDCVKFFNRYYDAFDTRSDKETYDCGVGTFESGLDGATDPVTGACIDHSYTFQLGGFANEACADVTVYTVPGEVLIGTITYPRCSVSVQASGKNSCSASKSRLVERGRWLNM